MPIDFEKEYYGRRARLKRFFLRMFSIYRMPKKPLTEKELEERRKENARRAVEFVQRQDRCH